MTTQLLQQQVDSAGNIGWILIDDTLTIDNTEAALVHINTLPAGSYMIQQIGPETSTILAVV